MAKVSLRAYNREIETMIDRGLLDEAVAHCRHILKTYPKHIETYRLLGKAYLEYKRYPDAADIFSRVLVSLPSDFVANVGMSIIRDEENRLDDAIWHMERAFETQPSNAAIQSELQRLYGRRDGVQPPRIRMTRGALAHMYVQGELYPQAISEIKAVLKEDPGRVDMQVLLARAYYRSGLKNDAAEVASSILRNYPYSLDANRVLVEILGVDRPESVQAYRQRVIELDPYAAQVSSSIFLTDEVPDNAVNVERLDWNGQPVGMQPDWEARQAISLESGSRRDEQPDWLKSGFSEPSASMQSAPANPFDAAPTPAQPENDIPDFLRDAGWGKSTGAFDESKSAFADAEPAAATDQPLEQGDLPDWVKALAPQKPVETPTEEEELPDWINKIGSSALPTSAEPAEQPDWLNQPAQTPAQPTEEEPDWLKQFSATEQPATPASEEPDWLKGFGNEAEPVNSVESAAELDWLNQLSQPSEPKAEETAADDLDFLKQLGLQPEASSASTDDFDFLNPLGVQASGPQTEASSEEFDFLNALTQEPAQATPATTPEASIPEHSTPTTLGMSEEEQDDSFAWLESLAAKQGATEGLLTKPEERLDEEPDWVKQAKGVEVGQPPVQQEEQPPVSQPSANLEELGKTEQEFDDSFAWLESLAAKQGATEGLLTKPEERREEEPEWVRQAKTLSSQPQEPVAEQTPPVETPSVTEPVASVEDLGKSAQEQDDAFAWLESLAAKQGATEGLLTKPEERREEEPEWVRHAKDVTQEPSISEPVSEQPALDDTSAWLRSLDEETTPASPAQAREAEPDWLRQDQDLRAEEPSLTPVEQSPALDQTAAWLRNLDEETTAAEKSEQVEETNWMQQNQDLSAEEISPVTSESDRSPIRDETATWLRSLDEEAIPTPEPTSSRDDTAIWLKGLDDLQEVTPEPAQPAASEDLPAWMQNIEEELPAGESPLPEISPEALEPTQWMSAVEQESVMEAATPTDQTTPQVPAEEIPSWLSELDKEEEEQAVTPRITGEDLPAWLRDETGETLVEPAQVERTRATDWRPAEVQAQQPEPEAVAPEPVTPAAEPEPVPPVFAEQRQPESVAAEPVTPPPSVEDFDVVSILEEKIVPSEPKQEKPAPKPQREPAVRKVTGTLTDPVLGQARHEMSRSNLPHALDSYSRLIKKGRYLEDIIHDLREASYRYPVEVNIWQALGDAYMRSNRLQDALDAYTKAEELLR